MLTVLFSVINFNLKKRNHFYRKSFHDGVAKIGSHAFCKIKRGIFFVFWKHGYKNCSLAHVRRNVCSRNRNERSA